MELQYSKNPYIQHFGIKHRSGRYKWGSGARPYQGEGFVMRNPNNIGTKARVVRAKVYNYAQPNIKQGKGKADKSAFEVTADRTNKALDSANGTFRAFRDLKSNAQDTQLALKASKMSDEDLRKVVQRRNLEEQYVRAMHDPAKEHGFEVANAVLSTVGSVVAVAGGVAGIYSAFHNKIKIEAPD